MTDNLFQKLEEKMMSLLAELEDCRKEMKRMNAEITSLIVDRENHSRKLQDLISLLDTVSGVDTLMSNVNMVGFEPVLIQGGEA